MDLPVYGWSESIYNYLLNSKLTTIDERDEKQICYPCRLTCFHSYAV